MSRTYRTRWMFDPKGELPHTGRGLWGGLVLARRVRHGGECGCKYCCSGTKKFFKNLEHRQARNAGKKEIRNERP